MLTTALEEGPGCHQCLKDRKVKRTWDLELHSGESKGNQKQKWGDGWWEEQGTIERMFKMLKKQKNLKLKKQKEV